MKAPSMQMGRGFRYWENVSVRLSSWDGNEVQITEYAFRRRAAELSMEVRGIFGDICQRVSNLIEASTVRSCQVLNRDEGRLALST
jgi:hypothetical protein